MPVSGIPKDWELKEGDKRVTRWGVVGEAFVGPPYRPDKCDLLPLLSRQPRVAMTSDK